MNVKPDRTARGVRFGCGALLGLACGLLILMRTFVPLSPGVVIAGCLLFMVVFGALATRYGDRFWYAILDRWL